MKQKLTNNLLLKIISVVIALAVWFLVENVNDPVVVKSYSVPVTIQNSAYLESGGMTYVLEEEQQAVTVILRGRSSVVEGRATDITAIADLTQIVDMNTTPVMVPITVNCDRVDQENITVVPSAIGIEIEDMVSKDFTISVTEGAGITNKDYEVGTMEASPEKVTITGAESLISKIDRVTAEIDTANLKEDMVQTCSLKIYDKNQDELSTTQMKYLKFDIGEPVVDVTIDLWNIRDDIKFDVDYVGTPASGYQVSSVTLTPESISVAGTDEALALLEQQGNTIEIPAEAIDVSGRSSDFETRLNLADYMPENIIPANSVKTAIVNVTIIPIGSRQYTEATKDIVIKNMDEDLRLVFDTDRLIIRVKGSDDVLDALTAERIGMSVDMEGKGAGNYEVPVEVELPDGCELLTTLKLLVHVSQLE